MAQRPDSPRRRAVHISTVHPALDARIFYREALALRDHGYDVTVFGVYPGDATVEGVSVRSVRAVSGRLWRMATSWWRGLRAVRAVPGDIYHFHDPELLPALLAAKWLLHKRVVYDAHEDTALVMLKDWIPRWLRRPLARMVEAVDSFCASRGEAVVVPTRRLREKYQGKAKRVLMFVNYPAPEFVRARDAVWRPYEERTNTVVHLGTLSLHRLRIVADVALQFLRSHQGWSWMLLGLHPEAIEWFRANVQDDLGGRLRAVGKMPHLEVPARLCAARIGVNYHPLESRQVQVAIPLKVFEYLACGLSVLSTRVPLLVELVEDCPAMAFADEDPAAFLAGLETLVASGDLARRSAEARRFSEERFNCRAEGDKLAALYEQILGQGTAHG